MASGSSSKESLPLIERESVAGPSRATYYGAAMFPESRAEETETRVRPTKSKDETEPDSIPREEGEDEHIPTNGESFHRRVRPPTLKTLPVADIVGMSGVWGNWQFYSRYISNSLYFVPMHLLLLAMAVSAYVMGFTYWHECPLNSLIAPLFVVMGVLGFLCSVLQLVRLFLCRRPSSSRCHDFCLRCLLLLGYTLFLISYFIEVCLFVSRGPTHERKSADFCHYDFYTYCYWMNWSLFVFLVVFSLLQGPALKSTGLFSQNQ